MNPASNLVLVGPMGAGKSCVGRILADRLGLRLMDVDREIEQRAGTDISMIFACEGEAGFRARERGVLTELLADDGLVLSTGGGAVLDADNRRRLRERGFVVHLHVNVACQIERLARDRTRPLLARGDREAVLHALAAEREPLYAHVADLRLDTSHLTATEVASQLVRELQSHWHRQAPQPTRLAARAAKEPT